MHYPRRSYRRNPPKQYTHFFSLGFAVPHSKREDGSDVTEEELYHYLMRRIRDLRENGELLEAVGIPDDTEEEG